MSASDSVTLKIEATRSFETLDRNFDVRREKLENSVTWKTQYKFENLYTSKLRCWELFLRERKYFIDFDLSADMSECWGPSRIAGHALACLS
jgi:hypothetical protein